MEKLKYVKYFIHTFVLNNVIICCRFCMKVFPPENGGQVRRKAADVLQTRPYIH